MVQSHFSDPTWILAIATFPKMLSESPLNRPWTELDLGFLKSHHTLDAEPDPMNSLVTLVCILYF